MSCLVGGTISAGWCDADDFGVQQKRGDEEEGDGGLVQSGSEFERGRGAGALDGHEGVPTGADMSLARARAVIAADTYRSLYILLSFSQLIEQRVIISWRFKFSFQKYFFEKVVQFFDSTICKSHLHTSHGLHCWNENEQSSEIARLCVCSFSVSNSEFVYALLLYWIGVRRKY